MCHKQQPNLLQRSATCRFTVPSVATDASLRQPSAAIATQCIRHRQRAACATAPQHDWLQHSATSRRVLSSAARGRRTLAQPSCVLRCAKPVVYGWSPLRVARTCLLHVARSFVGGPGDFKLGTGGQFSELTERYSAYRSNGARGHFPVRTRLMGPEPQIATEADVRPSQRPCCRPLARRSLSGSG